MTFFFLILLLFLLLRYSCLLGSLRVLFMWEHPCVTCLGLIFFGVRALFSIDACHLLSQCMLITISLIGYVIYVVVTRALVVNALSGAGSAP